MTCCAGHCAAAGFFDSRIADRDLRRYQRRGPDASTRMLLTELRRWTLHDLELLDVGSGIGVIARELAAAGQAGGGEFPSDYANAGADIEKLEIVERPAAEFGEEHARTGVRAASLVAAQITIRNAGVEEARSCAMTGAAGHAAHLSWRKAVELRV